MTPFFRKFRRSRSAVSFTSKRRVTQKRHVSQKRLVHEQLEPRMMLSINPTGNEFLVNERVHGFQATGENVSSVAVSEAAGTIAVYAGLGAGRREGIFLRKVDQEAEAQLANFTIRGTRTNAVVAANDAGNTVVVWQGRGPGDKYGIFLQRFGVDGKPIDNAIEKLVNETTGGKQRDPAVAMAADGSFVVTWTGPSSADPYGVYARRFSADGTPIAGEELINTVTASDQGESAIAVNSGGDYIVTWSSRNQDIASGQESNGLGPSDWGVFGQRFSAAGARQGENFQINTTTAASQRESSIALQDNGTFMVVWSSFGQDGDSWAVVAQRFDATGTAAGDEFVVNTTTTDHQRHPQIAGAAGKYLITWQSGVQDGSGWEIKAQELDAAGNRVGEEQAVNTSNAGVNSGHQQHPAAALNAAGNGAVIWSGYGNTDRRGVFGRSFKEDGNVQQEPNLTPDLAPISDQTLAPGNELEVTVGATDPNSPDTLTYQLDPTKSPAGATIERTSNNTAVIRWTPTTADSGSTVTFRVLVTDNGEPPLSDTEEFQVTVSDGRLNIDLNGPNQSGADTTAQFAIGQGAASIADSNLTISNAANDLISRTTVVLTATPNGSRETLEADTTGTNIEASYSSGLRRLFLSGVDSVANYEQVLKTLRYNNTATNASGTRTVEIQVNDASRLSSKPTITVTLGNADLVRFAQELAGSGTKFYGAAWCPACTAQKELFEDGSNLLPFVEVTNPDRTRNQVGDDNNIGFYPTWVFGDGTRLEGAQTLETLSQRSGVTIPLSVDPYLAPIFDSELLVGSPLHVSLDGYDPNGGPLSYTVSTDNSAVKAEILSGNRSARVQVAGFGDMVFELFEQRAQRPTDRFIELANDDFYDDVIIHRVINNFVLQGGDPLGTGTGGSTLGDFDDHFHVDLQHNRTGLLSYAKSSDDTNDSQFFVTEGDGSSLRNLDFNHSIFGVLVEGESNRAAISDTAVNGSSPVNTVTMESVTIFQDDENGVLFLKADPGTTGNVTVTVKVTDQQGNSSERSFVVDVQPDVTPNLPVGRPDPRNGRPFLGDVAPVSITQNTTAQIQLTATDVEGDAFVFSADRRGSVNYTFDVSDTGLLTVTPPTDFVGTLPIEVQVGRTAIANDLDLQLITIEVVA